MTSSSIVDDATSGGTRDPLDAAVVDARRRYAEIRPRSADLAERARRVLPGGNTRSVLHFEPFPFRVAEAHDKYLVDVDGIRTVDLLGDYTAGLLGHSPKPVFTAAKRALGAGWAYGAVHPDEIRLAELIVERFASIEQVRFTNSGTEANLMALAVATHHTGRRRIVVFEHGYHGGVLTFGAGADPVDVPHDWIVLPYNDVDALRAAFAADGDSIAAILVEPMQGSGGCIPASADFLAALREVTAASGALLVFDEVMTSRFSVGGAQALAGVTPDLTTLGKYLAGGFPFGAFGGRADVMAHFDPVAGGRLGHAGTFNNDVASMAAGVTVLENVLTADVLQETHERGTRLREGLARCFAETGVGMSVTGVGSLMTIHGTAGPVVSAADLADADDRLKELFFFGALEAGWYLARRGFIALSVEIDDDDVDAFLGVAAEVVHSIVAAGHAGDVG